MGDSDIRLLSGRCECGAVQYGVADAFLFAMNGHCSACRAATDSAFKPFAGVQPTSHIFVGSKAPWFDITDDLPQFEDYPTERKGVRT